MSDGLDAAATVPTASAAAVAGARIGRFAVLEVLGQGGMGLVLAAYDPDLDRRVALKLLHPAVDDPDGARLLREARAMAKLEHPNVVTVHEVGMVDGRTFVAMEYASGGTLRAWLREPRPWREVLDRFLEAGRGLAAAHAAGMIDRDFKPDNVLLGSDGIARVADFGLVSVDAESRRGDVAGTPAYMAPEQQAGAEVGPTADQYAFSVSLWEGLYGSRPGAAAPERAVPAWLADVVRRGLREEPAQRWPSMEAMLAALSHDPVAARRRRLRAAGLAGAAITLGGLAVLAATRGSPPEPRCRGMDRHLRGVWDPDRAAAVEAAFVAAPDTFARTTAALERHTGDWVRARVEVCEATHVHGEQSEALLDLRMACLDRRLVEVDALVDLFAAPPSPDVVGRALDAVAGLAPLDACEDIDALRTVVPPPADPAARAEVEALFRDLAAADALEQTGQFRDGLALARRTAEAAERTGHAPLLAEALAIRATLEERTGDPKAAEATAEQAIRSAADARDDVLGVELCSDLVFYVGYRQGRTDDGLRLRGRCEVALRRAGTPPALEARLSNSLGLMFTAQGNLPEARVSLELALALWSELRGPDHHMTGTAINNLANVAQADGEYDEARRLLQRALAIREHELGLDHPDVAMSLNNLANAEIALDRFDEAQRLHQRALAINEKAHGPYHPEVALSYTNLGVTFFLQGRYAEARRHHERAVEVSEQAGSPDRFEIGLSLANLGETLEVMGDLPAARIHVERSVALVEEVKGADHPWLLWGLRHLGRLSLAEGKVAESRRHFDRAAAIVERAYGADHPRLAEVLAGLAGARLAEGDEAEAIALAERAVRIAEASRALPRDLADLRFTLARTLAHRDPPRALALARAARDVLATAGPAGARKLAEVEAWLAAR